MLGTGRDTRRRPVGNLCVGAATDPDYDADRLVQALVTGALAGNPAAAWGSPA